MAAPLTPEPDAGRAYIGRFAPSPTGPLHAGSLLAALASYLDARAHDGRWLLRIEDLDPPRESPGAATAILRTLERLGLYWDGEVSYQSSRLAAYDEALQALRDRGLAYPCNCSRQRIRACGGIYDGHCRRRASAPAPPCAIRCQVTDREDCFEDLFQGRQCANLARDSGDFVIRRKDGLHAYQLAVVVDDAWQGITHVVRGIDLLNSTPRQRHLQQALGLPSPRYGHFPVLVDPAGHKLSKQRHAPAADDSRPRGLLLNALRQLRQAPPAQLAQADIPDILAWGVDHWRREPLRGLRRVVEN